jgi:hypothetical protein
MIEEHLKLALFKMLPEKIDLTLGYGCWCIIDPDKTKRIGRNVLETELLHVCWLVEQTLPLDQVEKYLATLTRVCGTATVCLCLLSASWKQRAEALCKVKGITP